MDDMNKQQTRVALVTIRDPNDISSWSGTQYRVYQQLLKQFDVVEPLGPVELTRAEEFIVKVVHRVFQMTFRKYNKVHSLLYGYLRAKHFSRKIKQKDYSIVFASACCPVVAFLKTEKPIIYLSDATFELLLNYYEQFSGLPKLSIFEGQYAERKAIEKSSVIILSSEWARQSAIKDYGADPSKVRTCLFGANTDAGSETEESIGLKTVMEKQDRIGRQCDLLFLARDWRRKGGSVALDAFLELKRRGFRVTLTICGCVTELSEDIPGLTVIPYLDKALEADRRRYHELMCQSHFLILPTLADCSPMVFAEANAYGMPVITSNTGGIPSLINEENGYLLPPDSDGRAYADVVGKLFFKEPDRYQVLAKSSRYRYEKVLNWDNWGDCVKTFIDSRLREKLTLG
jgi:glycosyltransferase involved in cell wall biosynthesis